MYYAQIVKIITLEKGVEESSMMKSPCLRYEGNFMAMMFSKEDAFVNQQPRSKLTGCIQ